MPPSRATLISVTAVVVVAVAAVGLLIVPPMLSATDTSIHVAGDVQAPIVTIGGPAVAYPTPDYTVGLPGAPGATVRPAAASATRAGAGASRQPVVSGLLASVTVAEGDRVTAGQVVARLDTGLLDLGVASARADLARTRAQAGALSDTLDTLAANRSKLAAARAKLETALAQAVSGRAGLALQLAQLEAMVPPSSPMPTPTVPPAPPTPQQLIARLKVALAKLDAGIVQMRAGLAKIATGQAKLSTARAQVRSGRDLLEILAAGREIAVAAAEARRDATAIVTRVSGVVTYVRPAGTVVMVGAPIIRVRPDGPTRVDTYLTSDQLPRVRLGGEASIDFDSNTSGPVRGHITRIGESVVFPPTSFPTGLMHMTKAVLVTITLDDPATAPAGTPVDVTLPTE